jgi:copper chaperone CopZ
VQSALKAVKGVKEATVSLESRGEVRSEQVKVEDLIRAVKNARGMHAYDAKVKNK